MEVALPNLALPRGTVEELAAAVSGTPLPSSQDATRCRRPWAVNLAEEWRAAGCPRRPCEVLSITERPGGRPSPSPEVAGRRSARPILVDGPGAPVSERWAQQRAQEGVQGHR